MDLAAFSPFVPTATADSARPATVLEYTLRDPSDHTVSARLLGFTENPVCLRRRRSRPVTLTATAFEEDGAVGVPRAPRRAASTSHAPDIRFEDWERTDYAGWRVSGTAFGTGPVTEAECPEYFRREGPLRVTGSRCVT